MGVVISQILARHQGEVAGTVRNLLVFQLHVAFPREHQVDIPTCPEAVLVKMFPAEDVHGKAPKLGAQVKNTTAGAISYLIYVRRKFRSQTSDNMDRSKAEMGRVREKRRVEERRSEKRKSQKKEDADARKGRKVAKHSVFPMICGSGGSKSRLAKRRVRSHLAR